MPIELCVSTTPKEVEDHNRAVCRRGPDRAWHRQSCARCDNPGPFAPHDLRRRGLRLIVNHMVLVVTTWLARWKCRKCGHVFTDYPDFRTPI
jgi:hypothetical protein